MWLMLPSLAFSPQIDQQKLWSARPLAIAAAVSPRFTALAAVPEPERGPPEEAFPFDPSLSGMDALMALCAPPESTTTGIDERAASQAAELARAAMAQGPATAPAASAAAPAADAVAATAAASATAAKPAGALTVATSTLSGTFTGGDMGTGWETCGWDELGPVGWLLTTFLAEPTEPSGMMSAWLAGQDAIFG